MKSWAGCASADIRLTPQRYAVVRALVQGGEHPSAEQLFHRVSDAYPMMSRATVYKTLDTLKAAGEVLELEFREGPNRYDANMPSAHPHVVCTGCGRIDDVRWLTVACRDASRLR